MATDIGEILDELETKYEKPPADASESEGARITLRTLLVALLGVSLSVCAFASQPEEMEFARPQTKRQLDGVGVANRMSKPIIVRVAVGGGRLDAALTGLASLMLLMAVMSKESWSGRGRRWLSAPALAAAALGAVADAAGALVAAAVGVTDASNLHVLPSGLFITMEIMLWYYILKFFDYEPRHSNPNVFNKDLMDNN